MNNFRFQEINLNHIDTRFLKKFYATNGDYNGRGLRIHLNDNGSVIDTTGINLTLYYKKRNGTTESVAVTLVDATKGIYEVEYPTSMLEEVGTVECNIKVVDNGKTMHGFNFIVDVMDAFPDAQYSSNEATELQQLIADASAIQAQVANLQNLLNAKLGIEATAANSERLDGYDSSAFMFKNNPQAKEHMNMTGHIIYNLAQPSHSKHAVTKGYVDEKFLEKTSKAADSAKLDGKTLAELLLKVDIAEIFDVVANGTEIEKDFDEITKPGLYYTGGATLKHAPSFYYKYSTVLVLKRYTYLFVLLLGNSARAGLRVKNSSGWTDWRELT